MTFVRSNPDPAFRIVFVVISMIVGLLLSALRKKSPSQSSLPSFLFSEMKGPPYPHVRTIRTEIRGVAFKNPDGTSRQQLIRAFCRPGDALLLLRDPSNPVDSNAIAVVRICRGADGQATFKEQLGYLSKEIAQDLASIFRDTPVGFAEILEITGDLSRQDGGNVGVNIRAEVYMPAGDVGEADGSAA